MQFMDMRNKTVCSVVWPQFTFKVQQFYQTQLSFGDCDKKTCISGSNVRYFGKPYNDSFQLVFFKSF